MDYGRYSGVQKETGNFYAQNYDGLTRFLLGGVLQWCTIGYVCLLHFVDSLYLFSRSIRPKTPKFVCRFFE
jgi:hypothetical protein